jgi:hypothetical protein
MEVAASMYGHVEYMIKCCYGDLLALISSAVPRFVVISDDSWLAATQAVNLSSPGNQIPARLVKIRNPSRPL